MEIAIKSYSCSSKVMVSRRESLPTAETAISSTEFSQEKVRMYVVSETVEFSFPNRKVHSQTP
jgi:hypothetical protein